MAEIPEPIRKQCEDRGGLDGIKKKLPSKATVKKQANIFHAISDPIRLTALITLAEQPLCVCLLKDILKISDSKLSYHLNILKKAGLIKGKRQGSWIIYYATEKGLAILRMIDMAGDD